MEKLFVFTYFILVVTLMGGVRITKNNIIMTSMFKIRNVLLVAVLLASEIINAQGDSPCDFSKPGASLAKWYPDSRSLIYNKSGDDAGIYKINADGTGYTKLISSNNKIGHPSVAPDNETILFQKKIISTDKNVLVLKYSNGDEKILTDSLYNSTDGSYHPTGNLVAFTSEDHHGNLDIYIIKTDGTGKKRLTVDESYDYSPHWSPEGSRILFTSHREGHPNIYIMNIDGSDKRNLTPGPGEEFSAAWASDGQRIIYSSRNPKAKAGLNPLTKHNTSELYILNLKDKESKRITQNPDLDVLPHWSPDGKKIAFTTCATGNREIFIMNSDGTNVIQLTQSNQH